MKKENDLTDKIIKRLSNPIQKTTRKDIELLSSGITLLDLCLGGGWGKGFISNICGWEATGKTMIACETLGENCRNNKKFDHCFDNAETGFTLDTDFMFGFKAKLLPKQSETVEEFIYNVEKLCKKCDPSKDYMYVLDSLDGVSDNREQKKHEKDMVKVGASLKKKGDADVEIKEDYSGKPKTLSKFFRLHSKDLYEKKIHLMITSQLRDKVGVVYGKKEDRTGGKALKFYAAQIVWIYLIEKIRKKVTVEGKNFIRQTSTLIRVVVEKNKLGKSGRSCYLFIDNEYGIDDIKSNIYFLYDLITPEGDIKTEKKERDMIWDDKNTFTSDIKLIQFIEKNNLEGELKSRVVDLWNKVEDALRVERKKKF
jgi:RecA/RadA recombinase